MRRVLLVLACAATLVAGLSLPAQATHESSHACSDNYPASSEIHLVSTPITLNAELFTGGPTYLQVCYSTDQEGGSGTSITGGRVVVFSDPVVNCISDEDGVVALDCYVQATASGVVVAVQPRIQSTTLLASAALAPGTVGGPACLRGFTIWLNGSVIAGPYNIGIC